MLFLDDGRTSRSCGQLGHHVFYNHGLGVLPNSDAVFAQGEEWDCILAAPLHNLMPGATIPKISDQAEASIQLGLSICSHRCISGRKLARQYAVVEWHSFDSTDKITLYTKCEQAGWMTLASLYEPIHRDKQGPESARSAVWSSSRLPVDRS